LIKEGFEMTVQVQRVIETVRAFPISDQIEVLQAISENLQRNNTLEISSTEFWQSRSIEELARLQSAPVITDIGALAADFWPDDESADEFNNYVNERRRADHSHLLPHAS